MVNEISSNIDAEKLRHELKPKGNIRRYYTSKLEFELIKMKQENWEMAQSAKGT